MVRRGRLSAWRSPLCACLLLAIIAATATQLASRRGPVSRQDGFLAHGQISVSISGADVDTVRTKRCIANSVQAGIDVRQGIPVIISLDGDAVGGGDLSTGELTRQRDTSESPRATCQYKFSAPVMRTGKGQYTVDIGDAKIAFTRDDLSSGIVLGLS
jgi:hypothetical protein